MTPLTPLEALPLLNREWLHVFVAGPGQGEGIAVALPERGWLLVDGCATPDGHLPLEAILRRWRATEDDPVHAVVLTHPHQDHVEGVAELLEMVEPEKVAVTAGNDTGRTLVQVARLLSRSAAGENTRTQLLARKVIAALRAIERWEESHPQGHPFQGGAEELCRMGSMQRGSERSLAPGTWNSSDWPEASSW